MRSQFFDILQLLTRPLISLTAEEYSAVLMHEFLKFHEIANQAENKAKETKLIYGLPGLSRLLNCSHVTAQRIKNSGKLNGCFSQVGRKIIFDEAKVLVALQKKGVVK